MIAFLLNVVVLVGVECGPNGCELKKNSTVVQQVTSTTVSRSRHRLFPRRCR